MNLAELGALMDRHGSAATLAEVATTPQAEDAATLFEAMAQRMIPVPASYDHRLKAAQCLCGLLLEKLPRATTLHRTVLVLGKPRKVEFTLAWAHIAPGICSECCLSGAAPCPGHRGALCDQPEPELCSLCDTEPAALGDELCRRCALRGRAARLHACGETLREAVLADRHHDR